MIHAGYILSGQGRLSVEAQMDFLVTAGISEKRVYTDTLARYPGNIRERALPGRERLVAEVGRYDILDLCHILCLGMSRRDVTWFLKEMSVAGMRIAFHDGSGILLPDQDPEGTINAFARARKALSMRDFRARKSDET